MSDSERRDKPKVSIIVLNYNGMRFLDGCFQSLEKVDYPNFEVVMVDNKSTDDSVNLVKEHYRWVRVIEAEDNNGFAAGNNIGIRETQGEYVFLLNNDTICTPDFLSKVVEIAESDPSIGIVGAWALESRFRKYKEHIACRDPVQVSAVSGAAMLIKREVVENIGLLDEKCFLYWEDKEYGLRANLLGYRVIASRSAFVYHLVNSTGLPTKERWMYEFVKNKIYIHLKLMSWVYLSFFLPYELLRSLGRMILYPSLARSVLKSWWWNLLNLNTTLHDRRKIRQAKKISDLDLIVLMFKDVLMQKRDRKHLNKLLRNKNNER